MKEIPEIGSPENLKVNVDLSLAETVLCEQCKNATFNSVVILKKLSPLISPTNKVAYVPIQAFACNSCGHVNNELLPEQLRKKE